MKSINSYSILLVEDDPILGEGLVMGLKLEGYEVHWGKSFSEGVKLFEELESQLALVVLDIGLPDKPGTEICKEIRKNNQDVGIIFLTAQTDEETVVRGLEIGANDFVKKPFSHRELQARIKVLLRPKMQLSKDLVLGGVSLSPEKRQVHFEGKEVQVNRRQFDILHYFMAHPDQIITRDQLLGHLDQDGNVFDRTVDSHLSQLRKILKTNEITTLQINSIYGIGYRLEVI